MPERALSLHTAAERPDLWERGIESADVWPEYNLHGDVLNELWPRLDQEIPQLQFVLYDDDADEVVAEGHTGAFYWDGEDATLPPSFDEALRLVFEPFRGTPPPNTLCALAAETPRGGRLRGLAAEILGAMRTLAGREGLTHLVAPVRPSMKDRYPITPIEQYVAWRRDDGQLLDPWMRVHERLGARVSTPLPDSLRITGTVAEWESWTGLAFPASGTYVFPEGLAPLSVDREADLASYWEPNVWMIHPPVVEQLANR
ncbi:hypothetical protein [Nocardioides bigeumensis]|uniref:Transferase n=1 Tax=Nocardioides bigeumensis TaxID=433657 RepID=A0ABN2YTY3_9ACTN